MSENKSIQTHHDVIIDICDLIAASDSWEEVVQAIEDAIKNIGHKTCADCDVPLATQYEEALDHFHTLLDESFAHFKSYVGRHDNGRQMRRRMKEQGLQLVKVIA